MYVSVYVCVCMSVCMSVWTDPCMYVYAYLDAHPIYIYIYIYPLVFGLPCLIIFRVFEMSGVVGMIGFMDRIGRTGGWKDRLICVSRVCRCVYYNRLRRQCLPSVVDIRMCSTALMSVVVDISYAQL